MKEKNSVSNAKDKSEKEVILEVKDLRTYISDRNGKDWKVLDGVSFKVHRGETLGIIGQSGAGKTVLARSLLRLIKRNWKIVSGEVIFKGRDLLKLPEEEFNHIRGKEVTLVMQNPQASLDPIRDMTFATSQPYKVHVKPQIDEDIKLLVIHHLGKVSIPDPTKTADQYAHQLSGGIAQRVRIAAAIINNPELLIADEPVSNLDATIARQILELFHEMKQRYRLTMIFIAHNLGVIAEMSDYVAIMYAGKIFEYADVETIFYSPRHPYTQGLFYASPDMAPKGRLIPIPGEMPNPSNIPSGCRFYPRCKYAVDICSKEEPKFEEYEEDHFIACWRANEIPEFEND